MWAIFKLVYSINVIVYPAHVRTFSHALTSSLMDVPAIVVCSISKGMEGPVARDDTYQAKDTQRSYSLAVWTSRST